MIGHIYCIHIVTLPWLLSHMNILWTRELIHILYYSLGLLHEFHSFFLHWFFFDCSGKELYEFWKFCRHDEAIRFSNYFWASIASAKVLYKDDFSSIGGSGKGGYEAKSENEYCENCGQRGWKFDAGRWIPMNSVKSESYFENYSHRIKSDNPNSTYMVGSCRT